MTGLDALQSAQYITVKGKRWVVLSLEDWEALLEWLETLEDLDIARQALAQLRAAGGDRERAGWLPWDAVRKRPPYDYGDLPQLLEALLS